MPPTCHYILSVVLRWVLGFQWMRTLLRRFQGLEQTRRSRRMTAQISHWDVRSGTHQWSELQGKYDILMSPQLCFITIGQVREQLKLEAAAVRMPQVTFDHLVWWSWISSWIVRKNGRKKHKSSHLPEYLSRCLLMSYHMRLESFKSILVLVSKWINKKTVTITSNCIGFMWSMYVNWAVWLEDFRTYEVHWSMWLAVLHVAVAHILWSFRQG